MNRCDQEKIHEYVEGVLDEKTCCEVELHLHECPQCAKEVRMLQTMEQLLKKHLNLSDLSVLDPKEIPSVEEVWLPLQERMLRERATAQKNIRLQWWRWGVVVAASVVLLVVAFPLRWFFSIPQDNQSGWIEKGLLTPQWRMLYVHHPTSQGSRDPISTPRDAVDGQVLHPRDLVQFSYEVPEDFHVMIVSINSSGKVDPFVPLVQMHSVAVQKGKGSLPRQRSLILDEYIGPERFFVLYRKKPFTFTQIRKFLYDAWLQSGRNVIKLRIPSATWQSRTFLIHKKHKVSEPPSR